VFRHNVIKAFSLILLSTSITSLLRFTQQQQLLACLEFSGKEIIRRTRETIILSQAMERQAIYEESKSPCHRQRSKCLSIVRRRRRRRLEAHSSFSCVDEIEEVLFHSTRYPHFQVDDDLTCPVLLKTYSSRVYCVHSSKNRIIFCLPPSYTVQCKKL